MRDAFKNSIDVALRLYRGQRSIYIVFDEFDWNVAEDEVEYAAQACGFKKGWIYYHTGTRLQESRRKHEEEKQLNEAGRASRFQREQERMTARQQRAQADAALAARERQRRILEEAYRRAQQAQNEQLNRAQQQQFEWLFRAGMREAQQASDGCPGYIEPMVRRFGLKWPYTAAELKKAYRKRCMDTHPDRGGAAEAFQQVQKDNTELERYAQGAA